MRDGSQVLDLAGRNLDDPMMTGRFFNEVFVFGSPRRLAASVGRIELMDDIGLEYIQKQRDFEPFPQPEAKSEAISTNLSDVIAMLQSCGEALERTAEQLHSDLDRVTLVEALDNVRAAVQSLERLR